MNISLAPEILFYISNIAVTNTLFTSFFIILIILVISLMVKKGMNYEEPTNIQALFEVLFDGMYDLVKNVMEIKYAKKVINFVITFFIFILISNWFGLLPFVPAISIERDSENVDHNGVMIEAEAMESDNEVEDATSYDEGQSFFECIKTQHCYVGLNGIKEYHESAHVFRAPSSDLSFAIALALISVAVTNILGIKYAGKAYLKKYVNFKTPLDGFVGFLEVVSELGKLISFSFRLFGNVFAGEILLVVITGISLGLATLPFLLLEIFVGLIQAFVFFMLTSVFIGLAISHDEH